MITKKLNKQKLAHEINALETRSVSDAYYAHLASLHHCSSTPIIGFMGPPGVGKSTLIGALLPFFIAHNLTIGVLLVDPASEISGSALLADKLRILSHVRHHNVFIRSQSNDLDYGGIALNSYPMLTLMREHVDLIIVEAVGGGQRESVLAYLSDILVYCLPAQAGDAIQLAKSGNMEFPALHIITKADTSYDVQLAAKRLKLAKREDEQAINDEPFYISNTDKAQLQKLHAALERRMAKITPLIRKKNRQKAIDFWLTESIKVTYGKQAMDIMDKNISELQKSPFNFKNILYQ